MKRLPIAGKNIRLVERVHSMLSIGAQPLHALLSTIVDPFSHVAVARSMLRGSPSNDR